MNKIIIGLMAIYFLGDPDLQYLSWLGDLKMYVVAAALSLVPTPSSARRPPGRRFLSQKMNSVQAVLAFS